MPVSLRHPLRIAWLTLAAALLTVPVTAGPLTSDDLNVIADRISDPKPGQGKLQIAPGDTLLIERTLTLKVGKIRGKASDYEGLVTGIIAPKGVTVHPRLDSFRIDKSGPKPKVHVVYAIHVDPGQSAGGRVRCTLAIVERKGLANLVLKEKVTHWVKTREARPSQRDLLADFHGYRIFAAKAQAKRKKLAKAGLRLSLKDNGPMPPLNRAAAKTAAYAARYDQDRRRMWIAHRHLIAAATNRDKKIAASARTYLKNLDTPTNKLTGLPAVSLVDKATPAQPPKSTEVETLEPIASREVGGTGNAPDDALAPVSSYAPNSRDARDNPKPGPDPSRLQPTQPEKGPEPEKKPKPAVKPEASEEFYSEQSEDDLLGEFGVRKYKKIPGYTRGLVLDDGKIAHAAAFRMSWANKVQVRETASSAAMFFEGQIALSRSFGLELTIPTEYLNLDVDRARNVFAMGNPLVAAKWRVYLADVLGRRPALTIRARAGLPFAPLHTVPPTSLGVEDFTREAYFADTYAFFLEKADIGLGASVAWQWNILRLGAQFYTDYFIPVSDAQDRTAFFTINWGASVGALPFGDLVGFFAEARAVSLLAGPGRTEFFTYLGVRGHVWEYFEPAIWLNVPLGSVRNANTFQVGGELRFSYDVFDIVDSGGSDRLDTPLLD